MTDNSVLGADLALTMDEALRGITVHAARQIGMGHMIGTLEVGKDADFTILESNPYTTPAEQLSGIKVSETRVEGVKGFP